jgi:DNA-binding NarL/FixJ family response regulator
MLIQGLIASINGSGIAEVTGSSNSLAQCRNALTFVQPDVLLLDLNLPDGSGVDFCAEMHKKYPQMKIIILTTHDEYSVARRCIESGANGYVLKNSLAEELIMGIENVMDGKTFLCEEIEILLNKKSDTQIWLTKRERELLRMITEGYSNQEIADKVFLSIETIKTARRNLILKLGAKNSMILVKIALEKGLV